MKDIGNIIKFRAWDGEMMHDVSELFWSQGGLRWNGPGYGGGNLDQDEHALMRYTGIKDTHGTEIWEGDIVSIEHPQGRRFLGQVFYDHEISHMWFHTFLEGRPSKAMWKYATVVGNVLENPELVVRLGKEIK
jgi:hypothetical protein